MSAVVTRKTAATQPNAGLWSNPDLIDCLVCPGCKREIIWAASSGECQSCHRRYPIEDGIPILLRNQALAGEDEMEHEHSGHKQAQASFFDAQMMAQFERDRPR